MPCFLLRTSGLLQSPLQLLHPLCSLGDQPVRPGLGWPVYWSLHGFSRWQVPGGGRGRLSTREGCPGSAQPCSKMRNGHWWLDAFSGQSSCSGGFHLVRSPQPMVPAPLKEGGCFWNFGSGPLPPLRPRGVVASSPVVTVPVPAAHVRRYTAPG